MSTLLRTAFQFDMERRWPGMNRNGPDLERVFHIHRASHGSGWPRGFCQLNSSAHSWIFISVSLGSNSRSYSFTSCMVRTAMIIVAQKLVQSYEDPLSSTFKTGAGRLRSAFFPTVFVWAKAHFDMDFFPRRKSFLVHCKHSLSITWLKTPSGRRRTSCLFLIIDHFHPDYNVPCYPTNFTLSSSCTYSCSKRNRRQWLCTMCIMVSVKMLNGRGVDLWTTENKST